MKEQRKQIITVGILVIILMSAGISFFLIRDAMAKIPDDIWFITQDGKEYRFGDSEKKIKLVEFMYTTCPEICPTTTQKMNLLKKDLEKEGVFGDKVQFLSITFDLYKDTPDELKTYMKNFDIKNDGNWIFLTGDNERSQESIDNLKRTTKPFNFYYKDPGDGYYMHTTLVFLLDENNRFIKKFPMGTDFNKEEVFKEIMSEI
ncbi:SCO family protein [Bacillus marasmi]|uniref:SCO family protein n=1 Tax=Bacillus marasmi TaxID=1926279 RepID=UPI0011CAAAFF|nr:SCO family protein [Bacillus marasmi]